MRVICAVMASLLVLSCGGTTAPTPTPTPAPAPTQPTPDPPPPTPPPPAPAPTFVVSGTIRDDRGAPVPGAHVYVGRYDPRTPGPGFGSDTDARGAYSGRIPAGTWFLSVTKTAFDSYTNYSFEVAGDMTFDLTLKPGVTVSGVVTEQGVGPLTNATVEAIDARNAGQSTKTGPPGVPGSYGLHVLPGQTRIRVSKDGYDPVEMTVNATVDTRQDFTLKWAYGSCLTSVTPVLFDEYRSAGGNETVAVNVNAARTWTATPDSSWLRVTSSASQSGSGRLAFTILPHPVGATKARTGTIMIRCNPSEGQNVWIVQNPDCQTQLSAMPDSPAVFPATGGTGHLRVHTTTPGCFWQSRGSVDWIHSIGVNSWPGDLEAYFIVAANRTGSPRSGTFVVGEAVWPVSQY